MSQPTVTVLITAYNRPDELADTLHTLRRQQGCALEIIVIDDASEPSLEPVVRAACPDAVYLRNPTNQGYIANRSRGMQMARGEFIVSLDDDSAPTAPDALVQAVQRMQAEPEIGILALLVHHGLTPPAAPSTALSERYVTSYIGCGHVLRRDLVAQLGGYRDFYDYYGEEAEYALRALAAGWRVLLYPAVVIHHRVSAVGRSTGRIRGYSLRNHLWTIWLHLPWYAVIVETVWKLFSNGIEVVRQGEPRWGAWGVASFARGLPRVLRLRRPIPRTTYRLYNALRFQHISRPAAFTAVPRAGVATYWRWFTDVLWHRRRGAAFWRRRRDGIGRSALSAFSDHPE